MRFWFVGEGLVESWDIGVRSHYRPCEVMGSGKRAFVWPHLDLPMDVVE